jgi:hypothetical protein
MSVDYAQHPLTLEAETVLRAAAFETARVALPASGVGVLLAEDRFSAAAILGVDEWRGVASAIGDIGTDFANWAFDRDPREKQWDLYLVILIATPVTENDQLSEIEDVVADTRYLRRLVRHGVSPGTESPNVRTALAPLLPLSLPARVSDRDPHRALVDALRSQGVDADLAEQTVQKFIERGGRDG